MPYQVLNHYYNPAGRDDDDLAIFSTYDAAEMWIAEMQNNVGIEEDFFIQTVTMRQNKNSKLRRIPYLKED